MMRSILFISLLSIAFLSLHAQRELLNPLLDSKLVIAKGVALHDAGKFKEAIAEYLKVPQSDTGYSAVLHELMLSYYNDSNFVEAERYGNLALELFPHKNAQWYGFLADVYDDTNRSELALKAYDTILAQNPYSYLTWFNKGITLYRLLRYEEAIANFQQCIILNPYYSSAHYFLGQLAMLKGNMVQAMLSFATNMLVAPGNRYQKNALSYLVTISEVNTTATDLLQKYKPGKDDNFDEVQDILVSKVALDKKYKLKADLEDQIVRQLQVVMEKLEYNASDKGFWMQYYVPLFKDLWNSNQFEPLVFYMFSELDIKKIKEYTKKEKKKIEAFSNLTTGYLNEIRESHELLAGKRASAQTRYYIKNYLVTGKGAYGKNSKNEEVVTGPWEFYYDNGSLKSTGNFDNEGMRKGEWHFYFENGVLKELTSYSDNLANGKSQAWYDNGLPSTNTTFVADKIEGEETTYFFSGKLFSVINYKAGKKDGVAKYYNIDGYLRTVTNYRNDQQEGEETVLHPNGKTTSMVKYVRDMADGEYKEYFDNGKLKISGNYNEGKKSGLWNSFFMDGQPEQVENYTRGDLDGDWVSYYDNGKLASKRSYKKGEIDGKKEDFDDDGIVFCETIFERGRLRDIKFFDKKGTVISNTTSRKGNGDIPFYGADGIKFSQGYYSKDGLAEGKFTEYFKNGQISSDGFFKNGSQDGKKTLYYANNKLRQEGNYMADKAHGYFVNYYNNGQASDEGWYVDNQRQGTFLYYDLLGHITSKIYYLNDKIHGISEYFTATGKTDYKQYYDNSWFTKIRQYDSTGKIMVSSGLIKGEGKVRFNHFNGRPYFESNYKYYKLDSVYKVSNGDGSKRSLSYYNNGDFDSLYTAWYPNGKIQVEGKYINGNKAGTWKYYYFDGKLSETEQFEDGKLEGPDIQYNEDGTIDKKLLYKKGALNGETRFYGENNQLILVFYYRNDNIQGYSYEDKAGKLMQMIPFVKGAGTVDSYYKNGIRSAHMVFNEGSVEGERIFYFANGKEQVVGSRINGLENGSKKIYYPSGKIMYDENYYYGERHGLFKYYNENGTLISDLNYYLGSLHGDCKYYTSGQLAQTYTYHYGEMESKK
ncbi:MAG: tetratricopeptide repeat protein [Ferruginibacter sp.]